MATPEPLAAIHLTTPCCSLFHALHITDHCNFAKPFSILCCLALRYTLPSIVHPHRSRRVSANSSERQKLIHKSKSKRKPHVKTKPLPIQEITDEPQPASEYRTPPRAAASCRRRACSDTRSAWSYHQSGPRRRCPPRQRRGRQSQRCSHSAGHGLPAPVQTGSAHGRLASGSTHTFLSALNLEST